MRYSKQNQRDCAVILLILYQATFLHSLVTNLIGMKDDFEAEDFCTAVFDEFFFTCINIEHVVRHLMRLIWWVHPKLPPARLETLMKVAEPTAGPEAVVEAYEDLKTKISEAGGGGGGSPNPATEEATASHF